MRECGMKLNTVYNVTGELAQMGYVLPIHQKTKRKVTPPLPPPTTSPHPPPPNTQNATSGGSGGGSGVASEAASPQSTQQNAPQGVTQQLPSESPQQLPPASVSGNNNPGGGNIPPVISLGGSPQQLRPDFLDQMADKIVERFGVKPPPRVQPELPGKELPSARCFQA